MRAFVTAIVLSIFFAPSAYAQEFVNPTRGSLFVPREGAVQIDEGQIERDGVFAAIPVQFREVARLQAEVFENSPLVLGYHGLPAGAPLFSATFVTDGAPASGRSNAGIAWCGIALEGGTLCVYGAGEHASIFMAGSNYAPHRVVHNPYPASDFSVVSDPTAESEFPELEMVYQFRRWTRNEARIRVAVRAQGNISFLEEQRLTRLPDGSVTVRVGGGVVRLTEAGRDAATVSILRAPPSAQSNDEKPSEQPLTPATVE